MILVARNVAEALADYARELESTDLIKAAQTLPGYHAYERAIQSQYVVPSRAEEKAADSGLERMRDVEHAW